MFCARAAAAVSAGTDAFGPFCGGTVSSGCEHSRPCRCAGAFGRKLRERIGLHKVTLSFPPHASALHSEERRVVARLSDALSLEELHKLGIFRQRG